MIVINLVIILVVLLTICCTALESYITCSATKLVKYLVRVEVGKKTFINHAIINNTVYESFFRLG